MDNMINHGTLLDTYNYGAIIQAQANHKEKSSKVISSRKSKYRKVTKTDSVSKKLTR